MDPLAIGCAVAFVLVGSCLVVSCRRVSARARMGKSASGIELVAAAAAAEDSGHRRAAEADDPVVVVVEESDPGDPVSF